MTDTKTTAEAAELLLALAATALRTEEGRAMLASELCKTLRAVVGAECARVCPAQGGERAARRAAAALAEHLTCAAEHAEVLTAFMGPPELRRR